MAAGTYPSQGGVAKAPAPSLAYLLGRKGATGFGSASTAEQVGPCMWQQALGCMHAQAMKTWTAPDVTRLFCTTLASCPRMPEAGPCTKTLVPHVSSLSHLQKDTDTRI